MASNPDAIENEAVRFARRILGVSALAPTKEIRAAFAKRAKVVHPDRFDPITQKDEWTEANALLRELNEAYRLAVAVAEGREKMTAASSAPASASTPAPGVRRTYAPTPPRPRSRHNRESENQRVAVGFADIGLFLIAGIFLFFGGNPGLLVFLAIFFGIDFWMRWHGGLVGGAVRQYMLLPRKGLSFACMPMWVASLLVGVLGWVFPWRALGAATGTVAVAMLVGVALVAASFWYVDYTYEISRPD